jgi:hypothetical protein
MTERKMLDVLLGHHDLIGELTANWPDLEDDEVRATWDEERELYFSHGCGD